MLNIKHDCDKGARPGRRASVGYGWRTMFSEEYVVFDLETTPGGAGSEAQRIIQVGAVIASGRRMTDRTFDSLVRCEDGIAPEVRRITGLADEQVRVAPSLEDVMRDFLQFAGDRPLLAHNGAGFDFPVLERALRETDSPSPPGERLDTLQLAHLVFPRAGRNVPPGMRGERPPPGRSLDDLIAHFGVAPERERHTALEDALLTGQVTAHLLSILNGDGPARRLQRWILGAGGHPWARFLDPEADPPPLEDILEEPAGEDPLAAGGEFDIPAVAACFGEGGRLMTEGRRPRLQQRKMAQQVAEALAGRERLLVEAPTGTGKTLAYLVPAIEYARACGRPAAVAPHTRLLQDQISATLMELEGRLEPFHWTTLKGMENYLSLEALAGELDAGMFDPGSALVLALLVGWAAETPTGDWADLRDYSLEKTVPELLPLRWKLRTADSANKETKLGRLDFHGRACERVASSHVAVVNHALVMKSRALGPVRSLVVDEAHNLEDSTTAALTEKVDGREVLFLCEAVLGRRGLVRRLAEAAGVPVSHPPLAAVREAMEEVQAAETGFVGPVEEYVRSRGGSRREEAERFGVSYRIRRGSDTKNPHYRPVLEAGGKLRDALRAAADAFNDITVPEEPRGRYRHRRLEDEVCRLGKTARQQACLIDGVLWSEESWEWINIAHLEWEDGAWRWSLRRAPISVSGKLGELWEKLDSVCLTSATLQAGGNFSHLLDILGLGTARTEVLGSPFQNLTENHLLLLADYMPAPRGSLLERFGQEEAEEIPRLLTVAGGRALALFTARARLEKVRDHARPALEPLDIPLLAQGEGTVMQLVEKMRNHHPTSLLGVRSFWEGVDIPGPSLSLLVIEKIPFDSPADPVVGARMEQLELSGKNSFTDYMVPRAALRFAQGAGRLIRSESDVGASVVLDSRLCRTGSYQEKIVKGLTGPPAIREASFREEAYRAIADHLGVDYNDELREKIGDIPSADPWQRRVLELGREIPAGPEVEEEALRKLLDEALALIGFKEWRPGQLEILLAFMGGRDVLAVAPTGSGKSLTYQLPALLSPGVTLVISPLIALMRNQIQSLRARGVSAVAGIYSGVPQSEQEDILREAERGGLKLLYVSPERLWSPGFRSRLARVDVSRVAVDEAHCISQWGHNFRPEYSLIPQALREICGKVPTLAATATAAPRVREEISELLQLDNPRQVVGDPDRPEISYYRQRCQDRDDRLVQVANIVEHFRGRSAIVYVPTKAEAANVAAVLRAAGHSARKYHGGMTDEERNYVEEAFFHDEIDVVAATKAFGMGIDKPDIALIVHLEMPASVEEYVQETGRAARELERGTAVLLTAPRDCRIHKFFVNSAVPRREDLKEVWGKLGSGLNYVDTDRLLREEKGGSRSEAAQLALHYLEQIGAVRRDQDCVLQGRVTIDGRSRDRAEALREESPELAERAGRILDLVETEGGEYGSGWAEKLGRSRAQAESDLFKLEARDVIAFATWKYGWTVERLSDAEPDWPQVNELCDQRREIVEEKAARARRFARGEHHCLRESLLEYFGASGPGQCGKCDACAPDLPRPWRKKQVTKEQMVDSIEPRRVVLHLLDWAEGRNFSRRNLESALYGQQPGRDPLSAELQAHPLYGRLRLLGRERITAAIDEMIEKELVAEEPREFNGISYNTLVLTKEGRIFL